jgi:hypothetical protein
MHRFDYGTWMNTFDYDAKNWRDVKAKQLRKEGYSVKCFTYMEMRYPPSTYPPKSYFRISPVAYKVYSVQTVGRKTRKVKQ